jgi:putative transcriptional regulator
MPIIVQLDVMLAKRKMRSKESGKVRGVRFDTLEKICAALDCQPGELLEFVPEDS